MPSLTQKVDLLFKKFIAFKSGVNVSGGNGASFTAPSTPYSLEDNGSKSPVTAEQVLTQTKYIPTTSNPLNKSGVTTTLRTTPYVDAIDNTDTNRPILVVDGHNIIQRLDLSMTFVSGSVYAWKLADAVGSANWVNDFGPEADFRSYNIMPFSFEGTGTMYRYQLYRTKTTGTPDSTWGTTYTLSNEISFGTSDWFLDPDAVILNFLAETLPSGVTTGTTLYLRVYRYIGEILNPDNFNPGSIPTIGNKSMNAENTTNDGDPGCLNSMAQTPASDCYVTVKVNGVTVSISDAWTGGAIDFDCMFVRDLPSVSAATGTNIEFASNHNLQTGDEMIYKDGSTILYTIVDTVNTSTNIDVSDSITSLTWIYQKRNIVDIRANDIILWFQSNAGYNLDTNDRVDYEYNVAIV